MGRFIKRASPEEPMDEDPLSGMANLFDVSIVFIVGLMIALFSNFGVGALMDQESEITVVRTDAQGQQEILVKKGPTIKAYKTSAEEGTGDGTRLGTAYQLENGQVIYVPEAGVPGQAGDANAAAVKIP